MAATSRPRLSAQTASLAWLRCHGLCEACGELGSAWHHVFPQGKWPELADELENVIGSCERCHERHHTATERFPRRVCRRAEALADDRMLGYLDRTYGPKEAG